MTKEIPFRDVVVVNGERIVLELSLDLKKLPLSEQRKCFGGSDKVGYFYLFGHKEKFTDTVMECVMSPLGDSVTSLYKAHPIFESPGELIRARSILMHAIAEKVGLSEEAIGIDDAARGRTLGLDELSTGQLIDILAERVGTIHMNTDSHGQELPKELLS